jgi:hypothetical protein
MNQQERDNAGFAIELIKRTIMSTSPQQTSPEWKKALVMLDDAQKILMETGFYSEGFDPSLATY